jgi:hypothetical protein
MAKTMNLPDIKLDTKTLIDTAKEIQAGGEIIHQSVGEISISLDRLTGLLEKRTIKHSNGTVEKIGIDIEKDDVDKLINKMFVEARSFLKDVYNHQNKGRRYNLAMFTLGFISLVVAVYIIFG